MTYKQVKWLILIIPTITIGFWEYVRHQFLLPFISMEMGNWLATLIVFLVTITLLIKLFSIMEKMQDELNQVKAIKVALSEREKISRELHDGIAQSLFLMSIKASQLEKKYEYDAESFKDLKKIVHHVNEYVRQAISNIRYLPNPDSVSWSRLLHSVVSQFESETGLKVTVNWTLADELLSSKEKVELYACIREALINIRKHANATQVWIESKVDSIGWICTIEDDGKGFMGDPFEQLNSHFGLKIMKERAEEMNWLLKLSRVGSKTKVEVRKEEIN